jgi:hypothetical protein
MKRVAVVGAAWAIVWGLGGGIFGAVGVATVEERGLTTHGHPDMRINPFWAPAVPLLLPAGLTVWSAIAGRMVNRSGRGASGILLESLCGGLIALAGFVIFMLTGGLIDWLCPPQKAPILPWSFAGILGGSASGMLIGILEQISPSKEGSFPTTTK